MTVAKHVSTELIDGTLVVALQAELGSLSDEGREAEFEATVVKIADPQVRNVLIDLESAPYFGSRVLEWMVKLWKRVKEKEGRNKGHMALCNVLPTAREILHVARFDTIWPIFDSRVDALDSFESE
jgi:anti-anti-sigma factor